MNKCKKLIALLLAVLFVLPLGVLGVFAEDATVTESTDLITAENTTVEVSNKNNSYPANRVIDGEKYGRSPMATTGNTSSMSWYELTFNEAITLNKFVTYYSDQQFESRSGDFALDVKLENGAWIRVAEVHDDYTVYPKYFYNEDGSQKTYGDLGWTQEKNEVVSYLSRQFTFSTVTITALRFTARTGKVYNSKTGSTVRGSQHYVEFEAYLDETVADYTGVNSPATSNDVITNRNFAHATYADQWYDYAYYMGTATLGDPHPSFKVASANDEAYPNEKATIAVATFSSTTNVSYYQINFTAPITTNAVKIYAPDQVPNVPADYAVDVKNEYGIWTRVVEKHGLSTNEYRNFYFAPQTGVVAIRVSANKSGNTNCNNFMMRSLHVGFVPEKTPDSYTGVTKTTDATLTIPELKSSNLALNADVSVNAVLSGVAPENIVRVNDNSRNAWFAAAYQNNISWYQFDFEKELPISQIFIAHEQTAYIPADYAIDVKTADGYWVRVAEVHGATVPADSRTIYFETVYTKTVRITSNKKGNSNCGNFMVREIEIYHNPANTTYSGITKTENADLVIPYIVSDNLALGATITSSNTDTNFTSAYPLATAIDGKGIGSNAQNVGDSVINFALNNNTVGYYEIQFKATVSVNNLVLHRSQFEMNKLPEDFAVDVKTTDGYWVRVAEMHNVEAKTGWDDGTRNFKFETVENAVAIRLSANKTRGNKSIFRAAEIAVYNNPNFTAADYTGTAKAESAEYDIPGYISDNFALGAEIKTTSLAVAGSAGNMQDGKTAATDGYASVGASRHVSYFELSFSKATAINQVIFYQTNQEAFMRPEDYAVDVQLFNGTWKRVAAKFDWTNGGDYKDYNRIFNFETETVLKVRVSASIKRIIDTVNNATTHVHCVELQAFNNPNVTANDYTGISAADNWKYDILAVDHVKADLDGNGAVDANDLTASKKTILGVKAESLAADVNGDYVINILDYIATAKEIA